MRTTIRIDAQLLSRARVHAARSGITLSAFIEDALRQALSGGGTELPTHRGSRLRVGVDLDESTTLLDGMEGTDT